MDKGIQWNRTYVSRWIVDKTKANTVQLKHTQWKSMIEWQMHTQSRSKTYKKSHSKNIAHVQNKNKPSSMGSFEQSHWEEGREWCDD